MLPALFGILALLAGLCLLRRIRGAAFVEVNPRYREVLGEFGLSNFQDFFKLPVVIISGHPDRHVGRVCLGSGSQGMAAFLKREHVVRWRDRLASAWAGFGFTSKSLREARTLQRLWQSGIGCAEWIAVGEDRRGRAFLLLRELERTIDLQQLLREGILSTAARRRLARRLGRALAAVHRAGIDQPDLYSKHVFVDPADLSVAFLDWQRSRMRNSVSQGRRCRDLAALDATLADELVSPRERLLCLRAYFRAMNSHESWSAGILGSFLAAICRRSHQLLAKPYIRKERACTLPLGKQGILWLDGEACCVLQDFWDELGGQLPDWLAKQGAAFRPVAEDAETCQTLSNETEARLVARRRDEPLRWLWTALRRRPFVSPEVRQAGVLVRRRRQGLPAPRVLAFGQRWPLPWRTESFLLTEVGAGERREA